jgi:hypothetical protein
MMLGFFLFHRWGVGGKHMSASKRFLLASVSSAALALSAPAVKAADLQRPAAIARTDRVDHTWIFWLEGGAQAVAGSDPAVLGFVPGIVTPKRNWGWNGAFGFDYRIDSVWHASGSFRYGQSRTRSAPTSRPVGLFATTTGTPATPIAGTNTATRNETNWVADFMVGRDIGLGANNPQLKLGLRVADIRGKTEGTGAWLVFPTTTSPTVHTRAYQQLNHFFGVGPRLALEGSAQIAGGWFIDYMGGVAGLYSVNRSVEQTVTVSNIGPFARGGFPPICVSGCPVAALSETNGWVLNTDAMIGIGYAFTPYAKVSINYRIDAYFNAMRTFDLNGNVVDVNRIYHGPNVRLTLTY